ncbi:MAG TPA: 30S ribosome-binding factor RbfA [Planctomycetes bacterium]|nr:30S ribosome-binding factor RbfA [Planctomycetota bacterium]
MLPHGGKTPNPLSARRTSRRTARIAERIREIVSQVILFRLKDPRVGFVTVIDAEVTPDIKEAVVRLSVMGTDAAQRTSLRAINHSRGFIQHELGVQLKTRFTPVLRFELDDRAARAATLEERFDKIRRERQEQDAAGSAGDIDAPEDDGD